MIPHQLFQAERAKAPGRNVMSEARTSPAPQARYAVPAVLELRGVSKVYGSGPAEVHALCQAGLSVPAGSLVAVMGPSGSGKSTLLTIAGSLDDPTSGEVLAEGVPLSHVARLRQGGSSETGTCRWCRSPR
jgi:ABC-type bacteriocin/lantibiotic exporter with double-glycine peptidase domain